MYAVIKTGGKQYRVQAGDLLIVEKLHGEPGAKIAFDQVLMIGEGAAVTLGAPTVAGALVSATLVETRKGEKIKVFKKIRRQGYRRTRGHRQYQSVLRVTGIAGDGRSETWDGTVDLTPLATLNARARNLARGMEAAEAKRSAEQSVKASKASAPAKPAGKKAAAKSTKAKSTPPKPKAPEAAAPTKTKSKPKAAAPAKTEKAAASAKNAAKKASAAPKPPKVAATAKPASKPKKAVAPAKTAAKKAAPPAKAAPKKAAGETKPAKAAPAKTVAKKPAGKKPAAKAAKPTGKKG
jgi:large subunit ribosomal protein L21